MALAPQRAVTSAATGTQGGVVQTAKVVNNIVGDKELEISFTVSGEVDINNLKVFPGCWRTMALRALPAGVTFSSPGFANWDEFINYYDKIATNVYGMRMETTNVVNFQTTLKFVERDATGKDTEVTRSLSKYRVPVGSGYSETIELSEKEVSFVLWHALEVTFSKIKAGSTVTFHFYVRGWNKTQELNPMQTNIIQ